jgi:hypothetical protein
MADTPRPWLHELLYCLIFAGDLCKSGDKALFIELWQQGLD